jgi:hypothetical protein
MNSSLLLVSLYLYIGPVLMATVASIVTYHVIRDWRTRQSTEHTPLALDAPQDGRSGTQP